MAQYLFIGGAFDGTYHEVPISANSWKMVVKNERPPKFGGPIDAKTVVGTAVIYEKVFFGECRNPTPLFVESGMEPDECFDLLVKSYLRRALTPSDVSPEFVKEVTAELKLVDFNHLVRMFQKDPFKVIATILKLWK